MSEFNKFFILELQQRGVTALRPFSISAQVSAVAAGATANVDLPVGGRDFAMWGVGLDQTAGQSCTVQLMPGDDQQNYSTIQVPSSLLTGTAQIPFRIDGGDAYAQPLIISKNNVLVATVTNTGAGNNTITLIGFGFKLYGT